MDWFRSNLLYFGIAGAALASASFVRIRFQRPWRPALGAGVLLLVVFGVGALFVVLGTPGCDRTKPDEPPTGPPAVSPATAPERLRLDWDSEATANWPVAGTLAVISRDSYLAPVDARRKYAEMGFTEFISIVDGSMVGYVISQDDTTVIAFRGTDFNEAGDWIVNLGLSAAATAHGSIHAGFYDAYRAMRPQIKAIIDARPTKHLWITGHSLGGALALACAYDLIENEHREVRGLMTFGQPLVVGRDLANHLDARLLHRYARFVNRADIVPRIPPNYASCGSLVWFTNGGIRRSIRTRTPSAAFAASSTAAGAREASEPEPLDEEEFRRLQERLRARNAPSPRRLDGSVAKEAGLKLVDDHSMDLYVAEVRRMLHEPN
jgi:triacylglycerol lipase